MYKGIEQPFQLWEGRNIDAPWSECCLIEIQSIIHHTENVLEPYYSLEGIILDSSVVEFGTKFSCRLPISNKPNWRLIE